MTLAAVLTRLRCLDPDEPMFTHPETGERVCVPITEDFARIYMAWGLERAEWFANWGVIA